MRVLTHLHEHLHPVQRSRACTGHGARHGPGRQLLPPQTARLLLFCKLIWDGQTLANVQHLRNAALFIWSVFLSCQRLSLTTARQAAFKASSDVTQNCSAAYNWIKSRSTRKTKSLNLTSIGLLFSHRYVKLGSHITSEKCFHGYYLVIFTFHSNNLIKYGFF